MNCKVHKNGGDEKEIHTSLRLEFLHSINFLGDQFVDGSVQADTDSIQQELEQIITEAENDAQ